MFGSVGNSSKDPTTVANVRQGLRRMHSMSWECCAVNSVIECRKKFRNGCDGVLMQVFVATLVRGYSYAPEDVNEPWNNWPFGGEPVHDLQMQIKKI